MKVMFTMVILTAAFAVSAFSQAETEPVPLDLKRFTNQAAVVPKAEPREQPAENTRLLKKSERAGRLTEVSVEYSQQTLSNGYGTWREGTLGFIHRFSQRKVVYGSFLETERFNRSDRQAMIGFYHPLNQKWTLLLEGQASPTHRVLPKWSAMAQIERSLGKGWIAQAGYRRTELDTAKVNIAKLGVEKYWGMNRAAYTLSVNNLENTGTSPSQRIVYNRYYGTELSSVGVGVAFGREIENIGNNRVLQSDIYNLTLSGKHWFDRKWAVDYGYTFHKQGELYSRKGLNIGIRYKF